MPQLTDEQYTNKAVEELTDKYQKNGVSITREEVQEGLEYFSKRIAQEHPEMSPRAQVEKAVFETDKDIKAELKMEESRYDQREAEIQRGYKVG